MDIFDPREPEKKEDSPVWMLAFLILFLSWCAIMPAVTIWVWRWALH